MEPVMVQKLKPVCLLKEVREAKGVKQKDLAKTTGIFQQRLSTYENGKDLPSVTNLCRIATALDVSINDLIEYGV